MKAKLSHYTQQPQKVRLVANLLRGKGVKDARDELLHSTKRAALPMKKLLDSAVANAKTAGEDEKGLYVQSVQVNKGMTLRRGRMRARGSWGAIRKERSHVSLELGRKGKEVAEVTTASTKASANQSKKPKK